ncbi:peptide methionine sulfoxide reductase MsrA [Staphylotrichum tortipilum]|uniref:peptide-methionine (S)-S-oxide reductase n=1 Tax=Staphylotrichum tortipilum TaxID=2831512 RepID=A0AAN6MJB9_9PEZI|nr:peptide methionine sulfoxide reductase MsrA [Staphylotrichum longicolle]
MAFLARLLRPLSHQSTSTKMSSTPLTIPEGAEVATFAAGCFWGVEHMFRKHFADKGLYDARVGYIGGDTADPSYKAVCRGDTGHAEATHLIYNPSLLPYPTLLSFFYRMHDPTTPNQQGPDRGSQYRSAIFFHTPEQEAAARDVTRRAGEQWWGGADKVTTEVLPAGQWWDAEEYHQRYLNKNPGGYECPSHFLRGFPDLK